MSGISLREDLEPWPCAACPELVYAGQLLSNRKFYCNRCAENIDSARGDAVLDDTPVVENGVGDIGEPEVNFEENV